MRRDEVLAIIAAHKDELHALGVASLSLFGSVARDEARPDSDVDFLVELSRPMGMFKFLDIQYYLEDLFGRKVDLVTFEGLDPRTKDRILRDAVHAA